MDREELLRRLIQLSQHVAAVVGSKQVGSRGASDYDTAWLFMIEASGEDNLSLECFTDARLKHAIANGMSTEKSDDVSLWVLWVLDTNHTDMEQCVASLCDQWWNTRTAGERDLPLGLSCLLLAQVLTRLVERWDGGLLQPLPDVLIKERVPVVLAQLLNSVLLNKKAHVATSAEVDATSVAYEVLTCVALRSLPWPQNLLSELDNTINTGKAFLVDHEAGWKNDASKTLSEGYYILALLASPKLQEWSEEITTIIQPSPKTCKKLSAFFRMVHGPKEAPWKYEAGVLEGSMFGPQLRASRREIFPVRDGFKDEYVTYIPATWTIINNIRGFNLPVTLLWDMMMFSLWDFLVDEYMESKVALLDSRGREVVVRFIKQDLFSRACADPESKKRPHSATEEMHNEAPSPTRPGFGEELDSIFGILTNYAKAVLSHPSVRTASTYEQGQVRLELETFLIAHLVQMEDNAKLTSAETAGDSDSEVKQFSNPRSSFYNWARTTGSQHISCPVSFAFYTCLLRTHSGSSNDCFSTPEQKYKASDLCAHLAVLSRLYNDWSSVKRDVREGNLNSLNFPEFHTKTTAVSGEETLEIGIDARKKSLFRLAEYERKCSTAALSSLIEDVQEQASGRSTGEIETICKGLELFMQVTEFYADIYVARDLTNAAQ